MMVKELRFAQRAHLLVRVERNDELIDALLVFTIKLLIEMRPSLFSSRYFAKLSMAYWSKHFMLLIAFLKLAMLMISVRWSLKP